MAAATRQRRQLAANGMSWCIFVRVVRCTVFPPLLWPSVSMNGRAKKQNGREPQTGKWQRLSGQSDTSREQGECSPRATKQAESFCHFYSFPIWLTKVDEPVCGRLHSTRMFCSHLTLRGTTHVLRLSLFAFAAGLVACTHSPRSDEEDLHASPAEIEAGQRLAVEQCGTCHAIARDDTQSPMRNAPPFTYLGRNYPISSLAEALAEGMITGHDGMPEWELEPAEIRGLLGYIQSVQDP